MNVFTLCCAAIRATTLVFKEEPMVKKKIKFIAAATAMLMSVGGMSACGLSSSDNDKGQVYYLNSKPEVVDQFQELADEYTKETGIQVNVQTATSDNY